MSIECFGGFFEPSWWFDVMRAAVSCGWRNLLLWDKIEILLSAICVSRDVFALNLFREHANGYLVMSVLFISARRWWCCCWESGKHNAVGKSSRGARIVTSPGHMGHFGSLVQFDLCGVCSFRHGAKCLKCVTLRERVVHSRLTRLNQIIPHPQHFHTSSC